MPYDKKFYVYILTNKDNTVLYIGVTSNLPRRIEEHKSKSAQSFSSRYNTTKLVYYEEITNAEAAINREKQLKRWNRSKKFDLITLYNPEWEELDI